MQTKTILSTICCALLIMMSCTPSSEPESPEPIVITPDSDTTFQNITTWDTILCPNLKIYQINYFTSTIAGNDVGKIIVRKGNICSASESYATVDDNNTCIIRQCTVRITPSENGHDLFECHASVVGRNNKLMYHYIMGFIDYNPLWE